MRILYVSQYYPPEIGAPSARVSELARHWVSAGHEVTVLTGFPNHPTGVVHPDYRKRIRRLFWREKADGVDVVRTWLIPLPNGKPLERILNYTSFCISAALRGIFLRRPDIVIGTSPQLLVGISGWFLSKVKRAPFVFEVRDIWPDAIVASGVGRENSLLARSLRAISRFLHRVADKIVVVTPAFESDLVDNWHVPGEKIAIVQNGVETDLFSPGPASAGLVDELGLAGRFVISYVGTIGLAHGLGTILDVAEELRKELPEALFLIVGEGAEREELVEQSRRRGLDNVVFVSQQPRARVVDVVRASDVCLVLLKDAPIFETVIPTKMLEFMSCGRPVVLGVGGQARAILDAAGGGIAVPPESPGEVADALRRLHADPALRQELGERGRKYIYRHLSRAGTAELYVRVLDEILA
jgi:glycosyltransferase involved in cell wall biosynthesis